MKNGSQCLFRKEEDKNEQEGEVKEIRN